MNQHSINVDAKRCVGCTNCIKRCPTEAIRVQKGHAVIIAERCIDCGECLRECPHFAMVATTSKMDELHKFKYNIAIPSPALYAQFKGLWDPESVFRALMRLGFDYVYEEAKGAEIVSEATSRLIKSGEANFPLISTACPVVPRLIQVLYPNLIENLLPLESPSEVSARIAKKEFCEVTGIPKNEVGAFLITACSAKLTAINAPIGNNYSSLDGAIGIRDVYGAMARILKEPGDPAPHGARAGAFGIGWAMTGGESLALGTERFMAVDGIYNVIHCLDEIENERFNDLLFFEGLSCVCGCVGGTATFENAFVAKNRVRRIANAQPRVRPEADEHIQKYADSPLLNMDLQIEPRPVMKLDEDLNEALKKMDRLEKINDILPKLDCGSCGSPSCRTLAEDVVRGNANELDCIFIMRDKVRLLAQEMVELAAKERRR